LNGAVNSASKKHNSATIVVDDRQFCYRINLDGVFGTHTSSATTRAKAKFVLATDGNTLEAEDLLNGDTVRVRMPTFQITSVSSCR
jgi:hypothetical protein